MDTIKIAIALTKNLQIPDAHFGESDKFFIYHMENGEFSFLKSIPNPCRDKKEQMGHGDPEKGHTIARILQKEQVAAVVSRQFGKNLRIISEHFIPVIVKTEALEQTLPVLRQSLAKITRGKDKKTAEGKYEKIRLT